MRRESLDVVIHRLSEQHRHEQRSRQMTYIAIALAFLTAIADFFGLVVPPELYITEGCLVAAFMHHSAQRLDVSRPRLSRGLR